MLAVIFGVFLGGIISRNVFAESEFGLPDPGLTPESPIYFLDLWSENARLFFTRSDSSRAERYQERLLERLSEADALAGKGISATQRALELYRENMPFFYAAAERLGDMYVLAEALGMATDHLDALDHISERTDFEKKRFITAAKIFVIDQQLQSLHSFAQRKPADAFRMFGDALGRRMARIREVAIDDQNNKEAFSEYAAYLSEADRILRDWDNVEVEGLSPSAFLAQAVQGHEETLLGPVRERIAPVLENDLLFAVNGVRKLSGKEHFLALPSNTAAGGAFPAPQNSSAVPAAASTSTPPIPPPPSQF